MSYGDGALSVDLSKTLWKDALGLPAALKPINEAAFKQAYYDSAASSLGALSDRFTNWLLGSKKLDETALKHLAKLGWGANSADIFDRLTIATSDQGGDVTIAERSYARGAASAAGDSAQVDVYFGNSKGEYITGTSGADLLIGGGGKDVIDGGRGRDVVVVGSGGVGGIAIGGLGRDIVVNFNKGGEIYGDTISGFDAGGKKVEDSDANADMFWFAPDTAVMDAQKHDRLFFHGIGLVGGSANPGFVASGGAPMGPLAVGQSIGSTIADAAKTAGIYYDKTLPFLVYKWDSDSKELVIGNQFDGLYRLITGAKSFFSGGGTSGGADGVGTMHVRNFDLASSVFGVDQAALAKRGTLGMAFKDANPLDTGLGRLSWIGDMTAATYVAMQQLQALLFKDQVIATTQAFEQQAKLARWLAGNDPLVIDLGGNGLLTSELAGSSVYYNLEGGSFQNRTAWLDGEDGFLVRDRNGNGRIDDISEMFGGRFSGGYDALAAFDSNADGVIDNRDAVWAELKIWRDLDQDGVTDAGELSSLADVNIASFSLTHDGDAAVTPQGNHILSSGVVSFADGSTSRMYEAVFDASAVDTRYAGETGKPAWASSINVKGFGGVTDLAIAMANDIGFGETVAATAAAMTTPDLRRLVSQIGPVLGQWGATLEATRELTPVLLTQDASGKTVLADRAIYMEDASGGFWRLASGAPVRAADGAIIARPTMEQALAQSVAAGGRWTLEQSWSPNDRAAATQFRDAAPYLTQVVDGRAVILDYGVENADGSWRLASGAPVVDANGAVIAAPTRADILAQAHAAGSEWRVEMLGFNPYAALPVPEIGVNFLDGQVVDYTVRVTDKDGDFYVWARNLDRALQLQAKLGTARDFNLRNYEVDFSKLQEVNATDDSRVRVELLSPAQFQFAIQLGAVEFRPSMLTATIDDRGAGATGRIAYSTDGVEQAHVASATAASDIGTMIGMLQPVMEQYILTSRRLAVRVALQGGLKDFAQGLQYDAASDRYAPTTDRQLAPMFEAIFAGAPQSNANDAVADYLAKWNEILWQVYPDYQPTGDGNLFGATAQVDQAFIFQMAVEAFETVGVALDILGIAHALSINETRIVTMTQDQARVDGAAGADFVYVTPGDHVINGGAGSDYYFIGKDFGDDVIVDYGRKDVNELVFAHIKASDVIATREGQDLLLQVAGDPNVIRIKDEFLGELNDYYDDGTQASSGVDSILFADGVIWDRFRMAFSVAHPADTSDAIIGSGAADVIWGGKGNDYLSGGAGGDIYVYSRGDGADIIDEQGAFSFGVIKAGLDFLMLKGGASLDGVKLVRDGASSDLKIVLLDDNGAETSDSILIKGEFYGISTNLQAFGQVLGANDGLSYVGPNEIERIAFDDGTSLDFNQITERVLQNAKTDGNDAIYGFVNDNTLDGGAGSDYLSGAEGADTYLFDRGYGHDVIEDNDTSSKFFGDTAIDKLVFSDALAWTDFDYIRNAGSDTLTMRITGTDDQVTMVDFLKSVMGLVIYNRIEQIQFGDGAVWDYRQLLQHFVDAYATAGDDRLYGFKDMADRLDGGAGDDRLEGASGNDTYIFGRGYGHDVIYDSGDDDNGGGADTIRFANLNLADVSFSRTALDLIVTIKDTGETLTLKDQYVRAGAQDKAVETFVFADQTVDFARYNPDKMDLVGSSADETIIGSDFSERLDGRGGDDILIGDDGGDAYAFDVGYGHDTIVDKRARAAWDDHAGVRIVADDRVVFGAGVTRDNVIFTADGLDLVITITGKPDSLRIANQFRSPDDGVERFEFYDHSAAHPDFLTLADVEQMLQIAAGNRGDNVITGLVDQPNTLDGGAGDDVLNGGLAADTYAFSSGYGFDRINEQPDVAGVEDRVVFGATVLRDALKFGRTGDDLSIDLGNGLDILTIAGAFAGRSVESFLFADGSSMSLDDIRTALLVGTTGDDNLIGFDNRADRLSGAKGSDAMAGGAGDDVYVFGFGDGQDSVFDAAGADKIQFGAGVTKDQVSFAIYGEDLVARLSTGDSLVILHGASDAPVETFVFGGGETMTLNDVRALINAGVNHDGQDVLDYTARPTTSFVDATRGNDHIYLNGQTLVFHAGDGFDRIEQGGEWNTRQASAIEFADLSWSQASLRHSDASENDLILAFPSSGDQLQLAGALNGGLSLTLRFADGKTLDVSELKSAYMAAQATSGDDIVLGSARADMLTGGAGRDWLMGQDGGDTYVFSAGDGADTIRDDAILSGADTLRIHHYTSDQAILARDGDSLDIAFAGSSDNIRILDTLTNDHGAGVETIVFDNGVSWSMADVRQKLLAAAQTDGADTILGYRWDDVLSGGKGNDYLHGGDGDDTYVFNAGDGVDTIRDDWWAGDDTLRIHGIASAAAHLAARGDDLIITFEGSSDQINVLGSLINDHGAGVDHIVFDDGASWSMVDARAHLAPVLGGDGADALMGSVVADTLIGGKGDDWLDGGEGADTYIYLRGDGHDVIREASSWSDGDRLVLSDYTQADARAVADGVDLVLTFGNGSDSLRLATALYGEGLSGERGVEQIVFADGAIWNRADMKSHLSAPVPPPGAYVAIDGTSGDDHLISTAANEALRGGAGGDLYDVFVGGGQDIIDDAGGAAGSGDTLRLHDYAPTDLKLARDGDDLIVRFVGTTDEIRLTQSLGESADLAGVDQIAFDNGAIWTRADMKAQWLAGQADDGNQTIRGFDGADQLAGGRGNDTLAGGAGEDLYSFSAGDGQDIIAETAGQGDDTLLIHGLDANAMTVIANGADLVLDFARSTDRIILRSALLNPAAGDGVDHIVFDDATNLTLGDLRLQASLPTPAVYDADADFSAQDNPNGLWSYGYGVGGVSFTLFAGQMSLDLGGVDWRYWQPDEGTGAPIVGKNLGTEYGYSGTGVFPTGLLWLHPGPDQDAIVRWSAPAAGLYDYSGFFALADQSPSGIVGEVFRNDTLVYSGVLNGTGASTGALGASESFSGSAFFQAGDTLSFVVNNAGWYGYDGTALAVTVQSLTPQSISDPVATATPFGDAMAGGSGADTLAGGQGDDTLAGGAGDDVYIFNAGDGHDMIVGEGAQDGADTLVIHGYNPADALVSVFGVDVSLRFAGGADSILLKNSAPGQGGASSPTGGVERIIFDNGAIWTSRDLFDRLNAGDDRIRATSGDDILAGGPGRDDLNGGGGNDTYLYNKGDGADLITEGEWGGWADKLVVRGYQSTEVALHRQGDDLILEFAGAQDSVTLLRTLSTAAEQGVEQISFDDGVTWSMTDVRALLIAQAATDGADTIIGFATDDAISGAKGDDILNGGAGNDVYVFNKGDGRDAITESAWNGGADRLIIHGYAASDAQLNRNGDDLNLGFAGSSDSVTMIGTLTNEAEKGVEQIAFDGGVVWSMTGMRARILSEAATNGADAISGFKGNDVLAGGKGDDALAGGGGDDTYLFNLGDGVDTIREERFGGLDRLQINGYRPEEAIFTRDGDDLVVTFANSTDRIMLVGSFASSDEAGVETITFDTGASLSMADIRQRILMGLAATGADSIFGTAANDSLSGGKGDDYLNGGAGDDIYLYAAGDGDDRIEATSGADTLRLVDYKPSDVVSAVRANLDSADLVVTFATSGDRVTLLGALAPTWRYNSKIEFADGTVWDIAAMRQHVVDGLDTTGNDRIVGFDGADSFVARGGNDYMAGGVGADTYSFARGSGDDILDETDSSAAQDQAILRDILSSDVTVSRLFKGSDSVVLHYANDPTDSLTIMHALATDGRGVERYVFADGVVWDKAALDGLLANNAPVAKDDGPYSATSGLALTIAAGALLGNDYDPDNNALGIVSVDAGESGVARVTETGDIVFTPNVEFTGFAGLTYRVSDGRGGFASAVIDVRVRPVATARDDNGFSVAEDGILTIRANRLLANDLDGDRMIVAQVYNAQHGVVSLSSSGDISFTPDADYNGPAQFFYIANTPEGGRAEAVVHVDVTPVNDAPLARDDSGFSTLENQFLVINPMALLANDSDLDGDSLSIVSVASSLDLNVALDAFGEIVVTPRDYFWGTGSFDYTIADASGATATAHVLVDVQNRNLPPQANPDRFTTYQGHTILEDNPIIIAASELLANDSDYEHDPLTLVSIVAQGGGEAQLLDNGTILFTPNQDFNGEAHFAYTVADGQGNSSTALATLVYQPVNDTPIARDDSVASADPNLQRILHGTQEVALEIPIAELLKNDYDVEGSQLAFQSAGSADHGTVSLTDHGTIIYTPDYGYYSFAGFAYVVADSQGAVGGGRVTLYFDPTRDAPPVANSDSFTLTEDVPLTIPVSTLLANDATANGSAPIFAGWSGPSLRDAPLHGSITLNEVGDLVYTPDANWSGPASLRYTITDAAGRTAETTISLNILPTPDDPTIIDDSGFVSPLDVPMVIRVADILRNDYSVDALGPDGHPIGPNPSLTFKGVDAVDHGMAEVVSVNGEQFIVVRPDAGYVGDVRIQYRIVDAAGLEDTGFVTGAFLSTYSGELNGTLQTDLLIGNALDETIRGLAGADTIEAGDGANLVYGDDGADTIRTGSGADQIYGGTGDDTISAGAGDDLIFGDAGGDLIDGGEGFDTVDYAASHVFVSADLESRVGRGGDAQGDIFRNIEALSGSEYADTLAGDAGDNTLVGRGGADTLIGRDGADALIGGAGDDRLVGGAGADILDGGVGVDTADYSGSNAAVTVDLATGLATGGEAEGDRLTDIENLVGTDFADTLIGNDANNLLIGGRGDDALYGGAGDDILIGGRGADQLVGGSGVNTAAYSGSSEAVVVDMIDGSAGGGDATGDTFSDIAILEGSSFDDILRGDNADNVLRGGLGADILDGRGGFDTADYSTADAAISVNLTLGKGLAGEANGDTLISIEKIVGSAYDDLIIGSDAGQVFDGGAGSDTIRGGVGADAYLFGFGSGSDVIVETGVANAVDRILLNANVRPADISVVREGNDLVLELENQGGLVSDSLRVKDHFLGEASGVEQVIFADGAFWDCAALEARAQAGRLNAQNDIYHNGVEDVIAVIDPSTLFANDASGTNPQLTIHSVQNAVSGSVSITPDGKIAFLGDPNYNGEAFFDYTVADVYGRQSTARVTLVLDPVNDAPTAASHAGLQAYENTMLRIPVSYLLNGASDPEDDALSVIGGATLHDDAGQPLMLYHTLAMSFDGTNVAGHVDGDFVELAMRPDYFGFGGFTYVIADANGATAQGAVELYINPVNQAPRSAEDKFVLRLGATTDISIATLIGNDYDIEGDAFTFAGAHSAANGAVSVDQTTGLVSFTPNALGDASFQYDVIDVRGARATINVKLNVIPLNDPPVAGDDAVSTLSDQALVIDPRTLLANDSDPNGDALTFLGLDRFAVNGKVVLRDDGMIVFTPKPYFNGAASFGYQIDDGQGATATGHVLIDVSPANHGAILRNDVVWDRQDQPITILAAEAFGNDSDPEGDVLFFHSAAALGALDTAYLSADVQFTALSTRGRELPSWLSFDSHTLTFSGVTPADLIAPVTVEVKVYDPAKDYAFVRYFTFGQDQSAELATGLNVRDALLNGYSIRAPFTQSFDFAAGAQTSVAVTIADGSALPAWLSLNAATQTLSGAPPAEAAALALSVVYTHANADGSTVSWSQSLTLDPATIGDGLRLNSHTLELAVGAGEFSAALAGAHPLPDWLAFDPATRMLTRTNVAPAAGADPARVQIRFAPTNATQPLGTYASSSGAFTLEFVIDPNTPLDPAINALLADNAFFAAQSRIGLDLTHAGGIVATTESGNPLPIWLSFDPATLRFAGSPPPDYIGALPVRLSVTGDGAGLPSFSVLTDVVVDPTFTLNRDLSGILAVALPEFVDVTAPAHFSGALAIAYTTTDEKGGLSLNTGVDVVNVAPVNVAPRAADDAFRLVQGRSITISLDDILANDRDDNGDLFRALSISQPAHGTLAILTAARDLAPPETIGAGSGLWSATLADGAPLPAWMSLDASSGHISAQPPLDVSGNVAILFSRADGSSAQASFAIDGNVGASLVYTPDPEYFGTENLVYTLSDGVAAPVSAHVTIDVAPVLVANPDAFAIASDAPFIIDPATLTANDRSADNLPLAVTALANATRGAVRFDNGQIVFVSDHYYEGAASFDYTLADGAGHTRATHVSLQVTSSDHAPIAALDQFAGFEDQPLTISIAQLLANDSDIDGEAVQFVSIAPDGATSARVLLLSDGRIQFVPNENANGPMTFSYVVTDGWKSSTGHVEVDFSAVNDAPIANVDGLFTGLENQPIRISLASLLANDVDVEGDAIHIAAVLDSDNGSVVIEGTDAVFTPRFGYFGNAAFKYVAEDSQGAQNYGSVSLEVLPVYHPAIAVSDSGFHMLQDTTLDIDPAALLANDIDPDGNALSFVGFLNGPVTQLDNGLYRVTPPASYSGALTLTYAITNGSQVIVPGTVTIDVRHIEHAPVAVADSFTMSEDQPRILHKADLLANDYDPDSQAFSLNRIIDAFNVTATIDAQGDVLVTPAHDVNGLGWFDYEIMDSTGRVGVARVDLAIAPVNDAPTLIAPIADQNSPEDAAWSFTIPAGAFVDVEGDAIAYSARLADGSALPTWLSFSAATQTFTGTPPANWNGALALQVIATDANGGATSAAFSLNITPVNDAPVVATPIAKQSSLEDTAWSFKIPAGTFADIDGDALVYGARLASGPPLPSWLSFDAATQTFTGTPPANWNGPIGLQVIATDAGGLSAVASFILNVAPVNDAPVVAAPIAAQTASVGAAWTYAVPAATFSDVDGDALVLSARLADGSALPTWLTFNATTQTFTGSPPSTFSGSLNIAVKASDPSGLAATTNFSLTVTGGSGAVISGPSWGGATLQGTAQSDTINAYGWNNIINGNGGNDTVNAGSGGAAVTTGAGDDTIRLQGYTNIVNAGQGDNKITGSQGDTRVTVGDGNNVISTGGYNNIIVAGNGDNSIVAGAGNDIVTVGNGHNAITLGGYGNSVMLGSGTNTITGGQGSNTVTMNGGLDDVSFYGWTNHAILNAGVHATVHDVGWGTTFDVTASNVQLAIEMFDASGIIHLTNLAGGYTSAAAAKAALMSDGHGGAMLSLGTQGGYIDFLNVAPSQISAAQFRIG